MQIILEAQKYRRKDNKIYDGYGYSHLKSITAKTLAAFNLKPRTMVVFIQTLAEALTVFKEVFASVSSENNKSAFYYKSLNMGEKTVYLDFYPEASLKKALELPDNIAYYKVIIAGKKVELAAYDASGELVNESYVLDVHKYFLFFLALTGQEMLLNAGFNKSMLELAKAASKEKFIYTYALLYLEHQKDIYDKFVYKDISSIDPKIGWELLYPVKQIENTAETNQEETVEENPVFNDELLEFIPKLGPEFVLPSKFNDISKAIYKGDIRTLLLHGPAGTGKTSTCKLIAQAIGFPLVAVINCTENLDEFVLGKYIPMENRIIFKESDVTQAIRNGGIVVFEEINFARPQYLAFLNSLLDDNGFVRLDSGETVRRNKNFRFFATMNLGYFGTKELNQALYNRFNCIAEIPALEDSAIIRMLETRVPECKPFCTKILSIYNKIRIKIEQNELDIVISPRNLENWARLARYQGYVEAAETTIIPVARKDEDLEEIIRDLINTYKWK